MGLVEGLFICTKDELNLLLGETIYFGEILGKHSDVFLTITEDNLKVLSDDQKLIDQLLPLGKTLSGYNPLDFTYIYCECGENHIYAEGSWLVDERNKVDTKYLCDGCIAEFS